MFAVVESTLLVGYNSLFTKRSSFIINLLFSPASLMAASLSCGTFCHREHAASCEVIPLDGIQSTKVKDEWAYFLLILDHRQYYVGYTTESSKKFPREFP